MTEPVDVSVVLRYSPPMHGLVELLAIIRALKKFRVNLLVTHCTICARIIGRQNPKGTVTKVSEPVEVESCRL